MLLLRRTLVLLNVLKHDEVRCLILQHDKLRFFDYAEIYSSAFHFFIACHPDKGRVECLLQFKINETCKICCYWLRTYRKAACRNDLPQSESRISCIDRCKRKIFSQH